MIEFIVRQGRLYLIYEPEDRSAEWVDRQLESGRAVRIARTFRFTGDALVRSAGAEPELDDFVESTDSCTFELGALRRGYFRIAGDKLGIDHDVYLAEYLSGELLNPMNHL